MFDYLFNSTQGLKLVLILLTPIYALAFYLLIKFKIFFHQNLLHKILGIILIFLFVKFYFGTKNIIDSRLTNIRVAQSFGICKTKICKVRPSLSKKERRKVEKLKYGISDILKD